MAQENKTGLFSKIDSFCTNFNIEKTAISLSNPSFFLSKAKQNIFTRLKNYQLNLINAIPNGLTIVKWFNQYQQMVNRDLKWFNVTSNGLA